MGAASIIGRLNSGLFVQAQAVPVTAVRLIVGVLAVMCGLAASLLRTGGSGALRTVTFEDGTNFLTDAWNHPGIWPIFRPLNGYYVVGPRLAAWFAVLFPVRLAAAVLTIEAALGAALLALAVYVASGAHFRSPLLRLLVSAPIVVMAGAQGPSTSVNNNIATIQFLALYALFWMVIWVPASRTGRGVAVLVTIATAVSTLLSVLLLPLALVRLAARRERHSLVLAGALALAALANVIAIARHVTARPPQSAPHYNVIWALVQYAEALPRMIFGNAWNYPDLNHLGTLRVRAMMGAAPHTPLWLDAAALVVIGVVALIAISGLTRPAWLLGGVAAAFSVFLFAACLMSFGSPEPRYLVAPALLLITAMAALLRPRQAQAQPGQEASPSSLRTWAQAPVLALAVLVAVVCAVNFRDLDLRALSPTWASNVAAVERYCTSHPSAAHYTVFITSPHWYATVPCGLVSSR